MKLSLLRFILSGIIIFVSGFTHLQANEILVETEGFDEPGGWVIDPQFIDIMSSPYLLAHGMGKPVNPVGAKPNMEKSMGKIEDELIDRIRKAFKGIKLGDGISLNMTEYYDSYESIPEYLEKAKFDERQDWTAIPDKTLEEFTVTFCFTDIAGFRFYLPAYMNHALRNPETCDDHIIYALDVDRDIFNMIVLNNVFTPEQMSCIIDFLEYCSGNDAYYDAKKAKINLAKLKRALK